MINIDVENTGQKLVQVVDPSTLPVIAKNPKNSDVVLVLEFKEGSKDRVFRGVYLTGDEAGKYFDDFISTAFVTTNETVTLTLSNK